MDTAGWDDVPQQVSTGALPGWGDVERLVGEAHARFAGDADGIVAAHP